MLINVTNRAVPHCIGVSTAIHDYSHSTNLQSEHGLLVVGHDSHPIDYDLVIEV